MFLMFLAQKHIIKISPYSFSTKTDLKNTMQHFINTVGDIKLYISPQSNSVFSYNYYISDVTTQASLNMQLANTRYKYKFVSFRE